MGWGLGDGDGSLRARQLTEIAAAAHADEPPHRLCTRDCRFAGCFVVLLSMVGWAAHTVEERELELEADTCGFFKRLALCRETDTAAR